MLFRSCDDPQPPTRLLYCESIDGSEIDAAVAAVTTAALDQLRAQGVEIVEIGPIMPEVFKPFLLLFYGGMVRKKNVISTMLQSFVSMAVITVLWVVVGFSLAFGDSLGGIIGDPQQYFLFQGVTHHAPYDLAPTIPFLLFALFQLKFAIITPALITGAFAERIRFTSYLLFLILFSLCIYSPLAHATWHPDGLLAKAGVLDFAGGTVVHMSAGIAALAGAIFLKRRAENEHQPARITYVLLGTGLLWFGWFGFNAGSAFGANALSVVALATTTTASAAAAITYILFDNYRGKRPSAMGEIGRAHV